VDFWVGFSGNSDPHAPIDIAQALGGNDAFFFGTPTDPDQGQPVHFQVELKPVGVPFDGTVTCQSSSVFPRWTYCRVFGLPAGQAYHWQARSVDSLGATSPWVSFGTNADPDGVDFQIP
jgi:hypothetical protein